MATKYRTHDIDRLSPSRSPAWRYNRIMYLIENRGRKKRPVVGEDDEYVVEAFKFLRSWELAGRSATDEAVDEDRRNLFTKYPSLYFANEIFQQPASLRTRLDIEARILARMTNDEIAKMDCVMPDSVEWYERIFFNVRDRLDSPSYIVQQVIGQVIGVGLGHSTHELTAKYWSYVGGPAAAEHFLCGSNVSDGKLHRAADFQVWHAKHANDVYGRRILDALPTFSLNNYNAEPFIQGYFQLLAMHQKVLNGELVKTNIEENIQAVLTAVSWSVGSGNAKAIENSPLRHYVGKAVEPRAADMLRIAAGEDTSDLDPLMNKVLPPPRKKEDENAK